MTLSGGLLLGGVLALVLGLALVLAGYYRDAHPRTRHRPGTPGAGSGPVSRS